MIMGLESLGTPITTDSMRVKLLQEIKFKCEQQMETEAALYTKTEKKTAKDKKHLTSKKCYACGKPGNFVIKCRSKHKKDTEDKIDPSDRVFATFKQKSMGIDEWYLDSCASLHMSGNKNCLKNLRKCDRKVTAANYGEIKVEAIGTAVIETLIRGKKPRIQIKDVLYIPRLAANLLSAHKIVARNYKITMTRQGCSITDSSRYSKSP